MLKMCGRCFTTEEDEIYPSKYFNNFCFCISCEREYEHKFRQFRINFINNQPERLNEKTSKEDAIV